MKFILGHVAASTALCYLLGTSVVKIGCLISVNLFISLKVRIIFSEVIRENFVSSSNS